MRMGQAGPARLQRRADTTGNVLPVVTPGMLTFIFKGLRLLWKAELKAVSSLLCSLGAVWSYKYPTAAQLLPCFWTLLNNLTNESTPEHLKHLFPWPQKWPHTPDRRVHSTSCWDLGRPRRQHWPWSSTPAISSRQAGCNTRGMQVPRSPSRLPRAHRLPTLVYWGPGKIILQSCEQYKWKHLHCRLCNIRTKNNHFQTYDKRRKKGKQSNLSGI